MLMADAVQQLAAKTPGKESMAMEAFAKALRQVWCSLIVTVVLVNYTFSLLASHYYC